MNAGQWGQITTVVILLGWYPAYRFLRPLFVRLRLRRHIRQFKERAYKRDHATALEIDKAWDRTYGDAARVERQRKLLKVADSIVEQDSEWQQRARRAEGLGFMDDVA